MPQFTDKQNRTWVVAINVTTVREVRNALGINLADLQQADGTRLLDHLTDMCSLMDVLCVVCRRQASALEIDDEAFASLFDCDLIENASTALLEALCDFFPERKRRVLRAILAQTQARLAAIQPTQEQIETAVSQTLDQILPITTGDSSGSSPASSASTPDR